MELSTAPKALNGLTGRELLPLLQDDKGIGAMLAELGNLPRGAMVLRRVGYLADTGSTADADPGAGNVRWNNAAQASATEVYIADVDGDAVNHAALWPGLAVGGNLYLYNPENLAVWQQWSVTTAVDAAGYLKLGVVLVASSGSFADNVPLVLSLQQPSPTPSLDRSTITTINHNAAGAVSIDVSLGDRFVVNLAANVTGTNFINEPPAGRGWTVAITWKQDATGSRTVVLPASGKPTAGSDTEIQAAANARSFSTWTRMEEGRIEYSMKAAGP